MYHDRITLAQDNIIIKKIFCIRKVKLPYHKTKSKFKKKTVNHIGLLIHYIDIKL